MPELPARARKITDPTGGNPFYADGRIIITALPQFTTLYLDQPIMTGRAVLQRTTPRQFSITFVGRISEDTNEGLRQWLDDLMGEKRSSAGALLQQGALGMRNRRFYLYEDRYWLVRHEGTHLLFPYPGIRLTYFSLELYLRVLYPFLRNEAGEEFRCW
jgi:hypothetical protein